ncbi:MAG: PP2C family protein-serine/threonine phosphatase [Nostocoides sp.]
MVTVVAFAAAVTAMGVLQMQHPNALPTIALLSPLVVLAGLFLRPLPAAAFYAYALVWVVTTSVGGSSTIRTWGLAILAQLVVMGFMLWVSRSRERLGVTGVAGERMFVDLRDRLRKGGELPVLPRGWYAEAALNSAYGNSFSGDFMLTTLSVDGKHLEIVVVDVSGKGTNAGTRALLLSGAFGGLLGSVRPDEFLIAANKYLLRQQWPEGFATCVHLAVDLVTGEFDLGCAGHPPAAQFLAGSGRWSMLEGTHGPLLGVLEAATFQRFQGQLGHGDALLLYTDGVIETRSHDLADGVDRMLGVAASNASDFRGLPAAICRAARSGDGDDRAVVLVAWDG